MSAFLVVATLLTATPITLEETRQLGRKNTQALQAALDVAVAQEDSERVSGCDEVERPVPVEVGDTHELGRANAQVGPISQGCPS